MSSQTLREARKYEEVYDKMIPPEDRPQFHLSARVGWMNDPNGFSRYKGEYHMFYQYHPYSTMWGPMHWAHAVSDDLLHWKVLPAALAPDEIYDKDGCFSGSALELDDGRQLLMYTGVQKQQQADGTFREVQTQCLAVGDGMDYVKYARNPVLDETDLPEGGSRYDFRDPKMWRNADGTFSCVIGNRPADGSGQILLYGSSDGFHWSFKRVLAENHNRIGKMWECPDFFELDGKAVILTSPQDMMPQGFEYHNGNGTLCLIGHMDPESGDFVEEANQSIDYGIDFYAPQTILTPDGRRVMIGWMQNWDTSNLRTEIHRWYGQMTIPREIWIRDGRLWQRPIQEIESLRGAKAEYKDVAVTDGEVRLPGVTGRCVDLTVTVRPADSAAVYRKFAVRFAQNEEFRTSVSYHPSESVFKIDRKFSGSRRAIIHQRRSQVRNRGGEIKLRLILDRFSAEVFVNDGEHVVTGTIYTDLAAEGISFCADGGVVMDVECYELNA